MMPTLLPVNQFDHFYRGGDRIGALRHGPGGPQRPEEWIGSTTARFGQAPQGLSVLGGGAVVGAILLSLALHVIFTTLVARAARIEMKRARLFLGPKVLGFTALMKQS